MILAAGIGSRLGSITETLPKALVEVNGRTMLERVARRLINAGADRLIINVSHHAAQIEEFVAASEVFDAFGAEVVFSRELPLPLETGGGILHAAPLFRRDAPFFVHNVDVICELELRRMYSYHTESDALATLAVNHRETSRVLLFDRAGLCGRFDKRGSHAADVHAECEDVQQFAFAGIHVMSPTLLDHISERGTFSIIDVYLRLAQEGRTIGYYDMGGAAWLEIGNPERLAAAREWAARNDG